MCPLETAACLWLPKRYKLATRDTYPVSIYFEAVRIILNCAIKRLYESILNVNLSLVILYLKDVAITLISRLPLISSEHHDGRIFFFCCAKRFPDIIAERYFMLSSGR
jgi:hypothetical protein